MYLKQLVKSLLHLCFFFTDHLKHKTFDSLKQGFPGHCLLVEKDSPVTIYK